MRVLCSTFTGFRIKRLDNKIAVVTGASSGIGRSIVERFVAEGAQVVAFARNAENLKALEASHAGRVIAGSNDVTRQGDLERLFRVTLEKVGAIDILVLNAGIARVASFEDSTAEAFAAQFSVNFFGAAETAQLFAPHIRKGGSIQFITSFLTQVGFPGLAIYSASKAALKSLSQTLAAELAPQAFGSIRLRQGRSPRRCGARWGLSPKRWVRLPRRSTRA